MTRPATRLDAWRLGLDAIPVPPRHAAYRPVIAALALYADPQTLEAWPSRRRLAAVTGIGLSTVTDALEAGVREGLLVPVRRGPGRSMTNRYRLDLPTVTLTDDRAQAAYEQWATWDAPASPDDASHRARIAAIVAAGAAGAGVVLDDHEARAVAKVVAWMLGDLRVPEDQAAQVLTLAYEDMGDGCFKALPTHTQVQRQWRIVRKALRGARSGAERPPRPDVDSLVDDLVTAAQSTHPHLRFTARQRAGWAVAIAWLLDEAAVARGAVVPTLCGWMDEAEVASALPPSTGQLSGHLTWRRTPAERQRRALARGSTGVVAPDAAEQERLLRLIEGTRA